MKRLAAIIVLLFSASLFAQNAGTQTVSVTIHHRQGIVSNSSGTAQPELGSLLSDLDQATSATNIHIAALQVDRWKAGWLKSNAHKREARELAASLQNNLRDAMPGLISQVQDSRGSMSATFTLYNDLSAVVESVGVLENMAVSFGRKGDPNPLHSDYVLLQQLRQQLASYIQITADLLEPVNKAPRPGIVTYGTILSAHR